MLIGFALSIGSVVLLFWNEGRAVAIAKFLGFATHPPLLDRIRALDPSFDGNFPSVVLLDNGSEPPPPSESLGRIARCEIPWLPPDQCELSHLDSALERFSKAVPQIKKKVLNACALTVAADGVIQAREAELLRAVADSLDCPIPPFLLGESRA